MLDILDFQRSLYYIVPIAGLIAIIDLIKTLGKIKLPKFESCNAKSIKNKLLCKKPGKEKDDNVDDGDGDDDDDEISEKDADDVDEKSIKRDSQIDLAMKKFKTLFNKVSKDSKKSKTKKKGKESILNVDAHKILFEEYDLSHFYDVDDKQKKPFSDGNLTILVKIIMSFVFSIAQYSLLILLFLSWGIYDIEIFDASTFDKTENLKKTCWRDSSNCENINLASFVTPTPPEDYIIYCTNKFSISDVIVNISRVGGLFVASSMIYKYINKFVKTLKPVFNYCTKKLKTKSTDSKIQIFKRRLSKLLISVCCNMLPRFTTYVVLLVLFLQSYGSSGSKCYPNSNVYVWFETFRFAVELCKVVVNFQQEFNAFIYVMKAEKNETGTDVQMSDISENNKTAAKKVKSKDIEDNISSETKEADSDITSSKGNQVSKNENSMSKRTKPVKKNGTNKVKKVKETNSDFDKV